MIELKHYLHLPLEKSLIEMVINSILRIELNLLILLSMHTKGDNECNLF